MKKFKTINSKYLEELEIDVNKVDKSLLKKIEDTSKQITKADKITDTPKIIQTVNNNLSLNSHSNTPTCPQNIREITPVKGCSINCRYCLVVGLKGIQTEKIKLYKNYPKWFEKKLRENEPENPKMYYLSPKTEVFSKEMLESGTAHKVLNVFATFVDECTTKYGYCNDTLFIVTKGGIEEIKRKYQNETILDILDKFKDNIQLSISLAPLANNPNLRKDLEPNAPNKKNRLKLVKLLQSKDILCQGALAEPVFTPILPDYNFFKDLYDSGIKKVALDICTTTYENLVVVAQIFGWHNKSFEKQIWNEYLFTNSPSKSGGRVSVSLNKQKTYYEKMIAETNKAGIKQVTYCRYVGNITNLPRLDYHEKSNKHPQGMGGCMAYLTPSLPKLISEARTKQRFSSKLDRLSN